MTKREKKPMAGLVLGFMGLVLTGWLVIKWAPDVWYRESIVIVIGYASSFLLLSWVLGKKKWGIIIATLIFSILLLNRLEIFDILTLILLIAILGLISLID